MGSTIITLAGRFSLRLRFSAQSVFVLIAVVFSLLLTPCHAWAESTPSREYQIKAAFLLNFARFVEWPAAAFPKAETCIRIGILGEDPFSNSMDDIIRDEKIHGHKIELVRAKKVEDLKDTHLIYISKSEQKRLSDVLMALKNDSILTASDMEDFTEKGGMIKLYLSENKVRFEINTTVAQEHSLKVSAHLLKLGKVVEPKKMDPK